MSMEIGVSSTRSGPAWMKPGEALSLFAPAREVLLHKQAEVRAQTRYGFHIAGLNLLVRTGIGTEVVPMLAATRIPNSAAWMLGLINLRGNLVPVFDIARALQIDSQGSGDQKILVFGSGKQAAGIAIDGFPVALGTLRAAQASSPEARLAEHLFGSFATDQTIWFELNHESLFERLATARGL